MTEFKKMKFSPADYVKGIVFTAAVLGMWYDLKTDFKVFKATTELRINALERQSLPQEASVIYKNREAVLPTELKLKTE